VFFSKPTPPRLFSVADLQLIAPELILTVCACVALVMEVMLPYRKSKLTAYFSLVGVALAFVRSACSGGTMRTLLPFDGFYGMVRIDGFALLFKGIFLIAAALAIGISTRFLDIEGEQHGEYYALVLFATVGMMFLACGYDLISLYISLELMALTFYVLVAFTKREKKSNEAAMKYFLLGAFSSGVLLYGMSLLYGVAGSTNLGEIGNKSAKLAAFSTRGRNWKPGAESADLAIAGLGPMLLLGMIALAPGCSSKLPPCRFTCGRRMFTKARRLPSPHFFPPARKPRASRCTRASSAKRSAACAPTGRRCSGLVAAITIMVGNWAAVTQENSKRLLAYSSISNAGYLLLGSSPTILRLHRPDHLSAGLHADEHGRVRRHHQPATPRNHRRQR
jgi:NADH-quinone oxidoreductase subunit N